jgi:hypothetical protein
LHIVQLSLELLYMINIIYFMKYGNFKK